MTNKTTDPVCKMQVTITDNALHTDYASERYYFCSQHCLDRFEANPSAYLKPRAAAQGQSTALYTCPMHLEIARNEPGTCPKCGMALEPRNATTEDSSELNDMTRRLKVSTVLALPAFLMVIISDLTPQFMPCSVSMKAVQ